MTAPVLLSLAFDSQADDVRTTAIALAQSLGAPLATVHALGWRPLESEAQLAARITETRERIFGLLAPARAAGVELLEPVVARGRPSELVIETSIQLGAQQIVTGGGGPDTVRRWLLGSVAESIVRASNLPVFVARGSFTADQRPVICPLDLSPHARAGLLAAIRMARLFGRPLVTLTVVPEEAGWQSPQYVERALPHDAATAPSRIAAFVESVDFEGVQVEHRVVASADAASAIAKASEQGWLLVMSTRSFVEVRTGAIGGFTERVLRLTPSSAMVLRVSGLEDDGPQEGIRRLGRLKEHAVKKLAAGEPANAIPHLELAVSHAPGNAALVEILATALEACGRTEEATHRRELAASIRKHLG